MMKENVSIISGGAEEQAIAKGGVAIPFPWRLHEMLKVTAEEGIQDIVSWAPHGRAFIVHKPRDFADKVLTRFFSQTKYASFQRQLNLYGFNRFAHGPDKGAYYHFCFIKGHPNLVRNMVRKKIKGTKVRRTPTEEPNFYDPAWKNHFGATVPEYLKAKAFNTVAPGPASSKKQASPPPSTNPTMITPVLAPSSNAFSGTPYIDILPAPPRPQQKQVIASVSDEESSWDSLDLDNLGENLLMLESNPFHFFERGDLDFSLPAASEDIVSASVAL